MVPRSTLKKAMIISSFIKTLSLGRRIDNLSTEKKYGLNDSSFGLTKMYISIIHEDEESRNWFFITTNDHCLKFWFRYLKEKHFKLKNGSTIAGAAISSNCDNKGECQNEKSTRIEKRALLKA